VQISQGIGSNISSKSAISITIGSGGPAGVKTGVVMQLKLARERKPGLVPGEDSWERAELM